MRNVHNISVDDLRIIQQQSTTSPSSDQQSSKPTFSLSSNILSSTSTIPTDINSISTIKHSLSNDIEILDIDHFDLLTPFQKDPPVSSLQMMTPKSTIRSRQASTTSSINTTIVLSPPISHDTHTRIIRCLANTSDRTTDDKKLRIPM